MIEEKRKLWRFKVCIISDKMNFNKKTVLASCNKKDINQLICIHYKINNKIYEKVKLGESNVACTLRKLKYTRNILRTVLLRKLIVWFKEKDTPKNYEPEISYAQIQEIEQNKKFMEEANPEEKIEESID